MGCLTTRMHWVRMKAQDHFSIESPFALLRDMERIIDGRQSFPSGHTSTAFVGMTFVSLFFAGKTAALCFSVAPSFGSFLRSRLVRLCLILSPIVFATWVAVTRIEDYVGSLPRLLSSARLTIPESATTKRT
jgi:membrane-associated phospholipid phosphatase